MTPEQEPGLPRTPNPQGTVQRRPYEPPAPIARPWEFLICLFILACLGAWMYGVVCLVQGKSYEGGVLIGGAALVFGLLFALTHRAVKARRKGPRVH